MSQTSRRHLLQTFAAIGILPPAFLISPSARAQDASAPPLSAFGKLPSVENVALSPDGKRVAMVMTRNGERIIVDYELATKKVAAGAIDADKIRQLMWADNDTILVWTTVTEKIAGTLRESSYASLMNLSVGKRSVLYGNVPGGVRYAITGDFYRVRTKDGYRITASSYRAPEGINTTDSSASGTITETWERCLYAFSTASPLSVKIDSDARPIEAWAIRADGTLVGRSEFDDDTKMWTLRYRNGKGWKEIFKIEARFDMPWLAGLGRDGNTLLVRYSGGENADMYVEFDANGAQTPLDIDGAIHSPIFHPQTYVLAGFRNGGPVSEWTFYDPVMQRLPGLIEKAFPESFNDLLDTAENTRQTVVLSENAEDPGTYFFCDFSTGDFKEIGSAYPGLTAVSPKSYVTYKAADGLEIGAWLTLPLGRDAKNLALVVLPHGGPESIDDIRYDWMSQALASRGYAVLQPNYRGSAGYGKAFIEKGYGEFGRKMQTDLSDGVQHLVKQGTVDPKRVAIAGGSYGGYAALAGVSMQTGIYRCAVAIAGISDVKAFLAYRRERTGFDGNSYSVEYWQRFLGAGRLEEISPIAHVNAITVPVLLIHGKDDTVVPFDQSDSIYDALKKVGKPVELVTLKAEDHWLSREPTRLQTLEAMVDFITKHNPPQMV